MPKEKFPITQYQKNCPAVKIGVPNGKVVFVSNEVKIVKVDDNKVEAYYDGWKETITAEGEGNERYNCTRTMGGGTSWRLQKQH